MSRVTPWGSASARRTAGGTGAPTGTTSSVSRAASRSATRVRTSGCDRMRLVVAENAWLSTSVDTDQTPTFATSARARKQSNATTMSSERTRSIS